jgi:hypothetical protein
MIQPAIRFLWSMLALAIGLPAVVTTGHFSDL